MEEANQRLLTELRRRAEGILSSQDRCWTRDPALRVIDCVLSLNRNYDRFVVPRLDEFERRNPDVQTVQNLKDTINKHSTPDEFSRRELRYHHAKRADTLSNVTNWLSSVARAGSASEQLVKLTSWAHEADANDYRHLGIAGFGLAGFQYLRMLFGANTTKPDVHIIRFVETHTGEKFSPLEALHILEQASRDAEVSLRDLDTHIWEASARSETR